MYSDMGQDMAATVPIQEMATYLICESKLFSRATPENTTSISFRFYLETLSQSFQLSFMIYI